MITHLAANCRCFSRHMTGKSTNLLFSELLLPRMVYGAATFHVKQVYKYVTARYEVASNSSHKMTTSCQEKHNHCTSKCKSKQSVTFSQNFIRPIAGFSSFSVFLCSNCAKMNANVKKPTKVSSGVGYAAVCVSDTEFIHMCLTSVCSPPAG